MWAIEEKDRLFQVEPNVFIPKGKIRNYDLIDFFHKTKERTATIEVDSWEWGNNLDIIKIKVPIDIPVWEKTEIDHLVPFGYGPFYIYDINNELGSKIFEASKNKIVNYLCHLEELNIIPISIYTDKLNYDDKNYILYNHGVDVFLFNYGYVNRCWASVPYEIFANTNFKLFKSCGYEIHRSIEQYFTYKSGVKIKQNDLYKYESLKDELKLKFIQNLFKAKINIKLEQS